MSFTASIQDGILRIQGDPDNLLGVINMLESAIHTGAAAITNHDGDPICVVLREDPDETCLN